MRVTMVISHGHHHDGGRSGLMVPIGIPVTTRPMVVIFAAFLCRFQTWRGDIAGHHCLAKCHRSVSDFSCCCTRLLAWQGLFYNLISSTAMVVGGVIALFSGKAEHLVTPVLAFAAASTLYVADLIPTCIAVFAEGHVQQMVMIGPGRYGDACSIHSLLRRRALNYAGTQHHAGSRSAVPEVLPPPVFRHPLRRFGRGRRPRVHSRMAVGSTPRNSTRTTSKVSETAAIITTT